MTGWENSDENGCKDNDENDKKDGGKYIINWSF